MLKLKDKADLDSLHIGQIKESLTLEYKASDAADTADGKKAEIAKDVLAFANAEGGQIVYGMVEDDHAPAGLDSGIDPKRFPGIWFEQVIQQSVSPQIEGLRILEIPLVDDGSRVAVVVTVPQAMARAPHQHKDGRYYRRHNFRNQIMADYEVRDMMRRTTVPDLFVTLGLVRGDNAAIEYSAGREMSNPVHLDVAVQNRSNQPAFHTIISIGIDANLVVKSASIFTSVGIRGEGHAKQDWFIRRVSIPDELPIFKEFELGLGVFSLGFHSRLTAGTHRFRITTQTQTPGSNTIEDWWLHQEGGHLRLLHPGHPFAK